MGPWGCQEIGAAVPDKTQQSLRFGFPKRDCREWCAAQPAPVRCQSSWAIIAHRSHQQADFLIFFDVFFLSLAVKRTPISNTLLPYVALQVARLPALFCKRSEPDRRTLQVCGAVCLVL